MLTAKKLIYCTTIIINQPTDKKSNISNQGHLLCLHLLLTSRDVTPDLLLLWNAIKRSSTRQMMFPHCLEMYSGLILFKEVTKQTKKWNEKTQPKLDVCCCDKS